MKTITMNLTREIFNPDIIIQSGQVFRMVKSNEPLGWYYAYSGDKAVSFRNTHDCEWNFYVSSFEDWDFWQDYFDLGTLYSTYNDIIRKSKDKFLQNALSYAVGMRILKQDLWETMVTFIISQQNNIPKITKTVNILCEKFGEQKVFQIDTAGTMKLYYAFPTVEQIANLSLFTLQNDTMLGYRAKYILTLAQDIKNGKFKVEELYNLRYAEAMTKLKTIYGVGDKVANCIALYGLHLMESYPIDTWMQKIIEQDYPQYHTTEKYLEYINSKYEGFQGYVQQLQFLFKRKFS